jgi:hypothetical protein
LYINNFKEPEFGEKPSFELQPEVKILKFDVELFERRYEKLEDRCEIVKLTDQSRKFPMFKNAKLLVPEYIYSKLSHHLYTMGEPSDKQKAKQTEETLANWNQCLDNPDFYCSLKVSSLVSSFTNTWNLNINKVADYLDRRSRLIQHEEVLALNIESSCNT